MTARRVAGEQQRRSERLAHRDRVLERRRPRVLARQAVLDADHLEPRLDREARTPAVRVLDGAADVRAAVQVDDPPARGDRCRVASDEASHRHAGDVLVAA
ncbi:hypothetical protein K2Z84_26380, partial [Candidatus Binatia bacterium]|nr:hypothetical protein [Candidatus Binatia bacterium]